jgi:hypothetical protein
MYPKSQELRYFSMLFAKNARGFVCRSFWCFFLLGALSSKRRHPVRNALLGGRQVGSSLIDGLDLIENEAGLICVQLAYLESHDPSLAVGKNREGEDRVHAECSNRIQSILFADQHRIIYAHLACVVPDGITKVDGDADYFDSVRGTVMPQGLQQRDFAAAWGAPGGPEVDQQGPSLPLGQCVFYSVAISQGDVRDVRWNGARRSRRFVAAVLLRLFGNSGWRGRWCCVDNALGARDSGEVRDEESRRASYADYRGGEWDTEAISHVVPGTALEALRFGLKARRAREANSAAFM